MTSILERHRERFRENPGDDQAFQALEEHHFLEGEWDDLIGLYQRRQTAPDLKANSRGRAALMVREANLWKDKKENLNRAAECFERALVTDPNVDLVVGDKHRRVSGLHPRTRKIGRRVSRLDDFCAA